MAQKTTYLPTRKWLANTVLAYTGLLTAWATSGWQQTTTLMAITVTSGAVVAYLLPNSDKEPVAQRRVH